MPSKFTSSSIAKGFLLAILFFFVSAGVFAQTLTISSSANSATGWSISGSTLTVTANSNIQASVIQNALASGPLTVVGNNSTFNVTINQAISVSSGNNTLTIGSSANTGGTIAINANVTNGGAIHFFAGGINPGNGVSVTSNTAGAAISLNATGTIDFGTTTSLNTNNGNISIIADADANGSGTLWHDGLTVNAGTGNILVRAELLYERGTYNTTGSFTLEPSDASFSGSITMSSTATNGFILGNTVSSLTVGKITNTQNITLISDLTVNGPISVMGGDVQLNGNITSTAAGNLFFQGLSNGWSITLASGKTISKTAGYGLLTMQGNGRINDRDKVGNITASGTGKLDVVMIAELDNGDNYGVTTGNITTNGGHLWIGGGSKTHKWNGLDVGSKWSSGGNGGNVRGIEISGNLTTNGGDLYMAGWGYNSNWDIGAVTSDKTISTGAGNVTLLAQTSRLGGSTSRMVINTTGTFSLAPLPGRDFGLIDLSVYGSTTGGNFVGTDDVLGLQINSIANLSGLVFGNYFGTGKPGDTPYTYANATIADISTPFNINGQIAVYGSGININSALTSAASGNAIQVVATGGNANLNANLTATSVGGSILTKATVDITANASRTFQTNKGDFILWADSDNNNSGKIQLGNNYAINTTNGSTASGLSGGGRIVMAGGLDNGANGGVANDGIPDGLTGGDTHGVLLGIDANSVGTLYSGGGDIILRGKSVVVSGVGVYVLGKLTANAGKGSINMYGESSYFNAIQYNVSTATGTQLSLISDKSSGDAITLTGISGTASITGNHSIVFNNNAIKEVLATGGGNISITGTTNNASTYGIFLQDQDILATGGTITLNGGVRGILVTDRGTRIGSKAGTAITSSTANIRIISDANTFNSLLTGYTNQFNTSGTITIEPFSNSFRSALTYPITNLTVANTVSGLTLGKATNTQNITFGSAVSIAGAITAYGGTINVNANLTSTATTGTGVLLSGQKILHAAGVNTTTQGATINYTANGAVPISATDYALQIGVLSGAKSTINANGGDISLTGIIGTGGVASADGNAGDRAVLISVADILTSGSGKITLIGDATNNPNVLSTAWGFILYSTLIKSDAGAISITGTGGKATSNSRGLASGTGGIQILSNSGPITINDLEPTGLTGTYLGLYLKPDVNFYIGANGTTVASSSSDISIKANKLTFDLNSSNRVDLKSSGNVILESNGNVFTAFPDLSSFSVSGSPSSVRIGKSTNTSNITLGSSLSAAGPIDIYGGTINLEANLTTTNNGNISLYTDNALGGLTATRTINAAGSFNYIPKGNSFTSAITYPITNLNVTSNGAIIGKEGNTANLTITAPISGTAPIKLYGGTVAINGALTATGSNITLGATTAITQTQPLVGSGLALTGSGSATLTLATNSLNTIAGGSSTSRIGSLTLTNNKPLTVGSVNPTGIYSTGKIELATLSGDLLVTEPINSTLASGDAIKLYADKDEVAGKLGDGNIKVSGNGSVTVASGARALLYSGGAQTSPGVITAVGGDANTRTLVDANTNLASITPTVGTTGKYAFFRIQSAPTNNANLSALTVSSGTLSPVFDAAILTYDVLVPGTVSSYNFTPVLEDAAATLKINDVEHTSGTAFTATLTAASTIFKISVTSLDASVTKIYTLRILRQVSAIPAPTGQWVKLFYGDRFDPNNDQQATADTDIVGNAQNPLMQAQQAMVNVAGTLQKVYYFRVRLANAIKNNGTSPSTSFYYGFDITNDQKINFFVEANVKSTTPVVAYHVGDPRMDGSGPSKTSWLNSTNNLNIERPLNAANSRIVYYPVALEEGTTTNLDLDAPVGGNNTGNDTWLEFAFTESSFRSFTNDAYGTPKNGNEVYGLVAFTSTSQTANGDIGGINDKNANLNLSWAELGVLLSSSLDAVTDDEELDPLTVDVIDTKSINGDASVYGVWNGDVYPNAVLSVTVFEPGTTTVKETFTYNSATGVKTGAISTTGYSWYVDVTNYEPGLYPVSAVMNDASASPTSATSNGTLLITRIKINVLTTDDTTPTFTGTTDQAAGASVNLVLKDAEGIVIGNYTTQTVQDGTWSFTVPDNAPLALGEYTLDASITVNTSTSNDNVAIKIVDTPEIDITSDLNQTYGSAFLGEVTDQPANKDVEIVLNDELGNILNYTVQTDANGNWRIDLFTLPAGNYQVYVSVEADGIRVADQGVLVINKKELTISGITPNDKVYDGLTTAIVTGTPELSGVVSGEDVNLSGTAVYAFAQKDVANDIVVNVSGLSITGTKASNYNLVLTTTLKANITKAPLTITADNKSKMFATLDPDLTVTYGAVNANFVNGETSAVLGGTLSISRESGEVVKQGGYTITASGLTSNNYEISFVDGIFTITPKDFSSQDISIAALPDVSYKGTAYTPTPKVYDRGGELTPDDFEYSYEDNIPAGTATVSVTGKGNYTGSKSITFEITKAPLIVKAGDQNKTFGATDPANSVTYSGFVNNEDETELSGSLTFTRVSGEAVGTYAITPAGVTADNYDITFATGNLTITAKAIDASEITVDPIASVTYNGGAHTPTVVVKDGSTPLTFTTDYTVSYSNNVNAGTATVTITGTGNYSGSRTVDFTINKASLTITAENKSKTFGAADPTFTVTYSGFVGNPLETAANLNGALSIARGTDEAVGTYTGSIVPSGYTSNNYTITYLNGDFTITAKAMSSTDITIATLPDVVYKGSAYEPLPVVKDGNKVLVKDTDYTLTYSNNTNAGTATVTVTGIGNYTSNKTINFTITKAPLTITADNKSKLANEADPTLTVSYSGFVGGENSSVLSGTLSISRANPTDNTPGNYVITASGQTSNNYQITDVTGILNISGFDIAASSITVDPVTSVTYNGSAFTPAVVMNNPAANPTLLVEGTDYTLTYSNNLNAGTASILIAGKGQYYGNRTVTFQILPRTLTVAAENKTKKYGEPDPTFTYTYSGNVAGETPDFIGSLSRAAGESVVDSPYAIQLGNLTLKDNGSFKASNYTLAVATENTLSVTKATLTAIVNNDSKFAGQNDRVADLNADPINNGYAGVIYSGFAFGENKATANIDESNLVITRSNFSVNAASLTPYVGVLSATGATAPNYDIVYENGDYNIVPVDQLVVKIADVTTVYGNSPTYTIVSAKYIKETSTNVFTETDLTNTTTLLNGVVTVQEDVNGTLTTTATFTIAPLSPAYSTANKVKVGSYILEPTSIQETSANFSNVILVQGNLTITQKELTATVIGGKSKVYDGTASMQNLQLSVATLESGTKTDLVTAAGTGVYTTGANVGSTDYTVSNINLSGDDALNYYVSGGAGATVTGTDGAITKKDLTVTPISNQSKTYNSPDPVLVYTYTGNVSEQIPGFTGLLTRIAGETSGAYDVVLGNLELANNGSFLASNYNLNFATGVKFNIVNKDINSADISVDLISPLVYNGANQTPTVTVKDGATPINPLTDYQVSYTNNKDVGTATVTITGIGQYSGSRTVTFLITKAPVTVTAEAKTKTFGTSDPSFSATYTGLVNNEASSVLGSITLNRESGENVGQYLITPSGLNSNNYNITYVQGLLTITSKSITDDGNNTFASDITIGSIADLEYRGFAWLPTPTITDVSFDPDKTLVAGTDYTLSYSNNINVGTGTVTITGKGNYSGTQSVTFKINKKALTVTADDKTKVFGAPDPVFTSTITGFVNGETVGVLTGSVAYALSGATTVGTRTITPSGYSSDNYFITFATGTLTITAKPISSSDITVSAIADVTYRGTANTPTPIVKDGNTILTIDVDYELSYASNTNAGTATVNITGKGNYRETKTVTFKINKAILTITAVDKFKEFGASDPSLTVSYSGFVNGETETVVTKPSPLATRVAGENLGTYTITASGYSTSNYEILYVPGTFAIASKLINNAIIEDIDDETYNGLFFTPDPVVKDGSTVLTKGTDYILSYQNNKDAGTATVRVTGIGGYSGFTTQTFTINEAELTITADDKTKVFGSADPAFTVTYDGFVNNETASVLSGTQTISRASGSAVGEYAIQVTGNTSSNYNITHVPGKLTITAKSLSSNDITVNSINNLVYNGLERKPAPVVLDGGTPLTAELDYTLIYENNLDAGKATIKIEGKGNYSGTKTITFTILEAPLVVKVLNASKLFGAADPDFDVEITGWVNNETLADLDGELAFFREAGEQIGGFVISASGLTSNNYQISYESGILTIGNKSINSEDITVSSIADETYRKQAYEPLPTIKDGNLLLIRGVDYNVSYLNNINAGIASLVIEGAGDYTGTRTITFEINKAPLTVTVEEASKERLSNDPVFTYSLSAPLFEGDLITGALEREAGEDVGSYVISLGTLDFGPNYRITIIDGQFTIVDTTAPTIDSNKGVTKDPNTGEFNTVVTLPEGEKTVGNFTSDEEVIWTLEPKGDKDDTSLFEMILNEDGSVTVRFKEKSVPGTYVVNLCATDASGNKTCVRITVIVTDDTPPSIDSNKGVTKDPTTGEFKTVVTLPEGEQNVGTFTADEGVVWTLEPTGDKDDTALFEMILNEDGSVTVRFKEKSVPGTYVVNLCATDASGNKTCVTITVIVTDDTPPIIDSNKGVTKDPTTGEFKTVVTLPEGEQNVGTFTADEGVVWTLEPTGDKDDTSLFEMILNEDGSVTVRFKEKSVPGTYVVNLCATDASGNKTCVTITVIVSDDTPSTIVSNKEFSLDPISGQINMGITLSEGEQVVETFSANEGVVWSLEPKGGNDDTALFEMILNEDGSVTVKFKEGSIPGTYVVNLCATDASGNKSCVLITVLVKGDIALVIPADWYEIAWGSTTSIPKIQNIMTTDGNMFHVEVELDEKPLNRFARGEYYLTGELLLPDFLNNTAALKADVRVRVLPKPAPLDILLSNNTFEGLKTGAEVFVGTISVVDPVDDIHWLGLPYGMEDNKYFRVEGNSLYWSSEDPAAGRIEFRIVVRVTDRDNNTLDKVFVLSRLRKRIEDIEIYNTFTPEGDGINDNWGVPEVRYYKGARIQVFERSGRRVFYTEDADIRWDGTYKGKEMPVGSYFWVLEVRETGTVRKGIVNLLRK